MEAQELKRQIESEERLLACQEAIYLRDAAYSTRSTAEARATEARSWALVLDEIPSLQVVPTTLREIKRRQNPYPPSARDVLGCFRGEEWQIGDDGKAERVSANGGAYESYDAIKARHERAAQRALDEPLPPLAIAPDDLKARLRGGVVAAVPTEPSVEAPPTESEIQSPRRESVEATLLRLQLHLDDSRDRRVLVWFTMWHRDWHERHEGAERGGSEMSREDIDTGFAAFLAAKMEAKS